MKRETISAIFTETVDQTYQGPMLMERLVCDLAVVGSLALFVWLAGVFVGICVLTWSSNLRSKHGGSGGFTFI